ncbi:MAG: DNA-directed RNA polymerase subunit alpha, partial [Firmicutes bacterium]|nr:DNA-directed RNA polymerase subunit alpha [Bacillota bacterium]
MELEKPRMNFTESPSGKSIKFVVEPLERGFGHTIGNMLRRVLLGSLPGAAVTAVKIDGVPHEFTTIKGVVEDVTDIVLNLKGLVLKTTSQDPTFKGVMRIRGGKPGPVLAKDIECSSDIQISNPDHHILTIDSNKDLFMEIYVGRGRGYVSAAEHKMTQDTIGMIAIDSLFSPVEKVNYYVEAARVGQKIDYDKLTLEVTTNGGINA